jgi:hypothetical protein
LASISGFSSPLADAIELTGDEPCSTTTRQRPAVGLAIANCVKFARGSLTTKNGACCTGRRSSGDVTRSPLGPISVIFGAASTPRATTVAPGRPAGSSISCS